MLSYFFYKETLDNDARSVVYLYLKDVRGTTLTGRLSYSGPNPITAAKKKGSAGSLSAGTKCFLYVLQRPGNNF